MNIKYPLLIPVIGHGATDIIDYPLKVLTYNIISSIIVYNLNYIQRQLILILFSIFHLSQDIPNNIIFYSKIFNIQNKKILLSTLFHGVMIKKPIVAKLYFLTIHTPLHYLRIIKRKIKVKKKLLVGLITSILSTIFIDKKLDELIENNIGKLWWIFPILPHIILTNKFNNIYVKFKKNNIINIKIDKVYVI